jgi:hypothetical protein
MRVRRFNGVIPVYVGQPGVKLKELMDKTKIVKHAPGAKPSEIGWCTTCKSLVVSAGELRPMYTQPKFKHLCYQVRASSFVLTFARACLRALGRACVRAASCARSSRLPLAFSYFSYSYSDSLFSGPPPHFARGSEK